MASPLNDIPPELKPLTPFLQRAQELKAKDPTMSYWCSYYAVQQGVHLKPRDKASRNYLVKLMAPLEAVREDPNSTVVTNNDAACAYIEDFALRVFDSADNEDRKGLGSRGTAKKFLAAANFLELLRVFEETGAQPGASTSTLNSQIFSQHKEKIRYAKWKAADIAKAIREGRRPSPGPAHGPDETATGYSSPSHDILGTKDTEPNSNPGSNSSSMILPPNPIASSSKVSSNPPSNSNSRIVSPTPGASRDASVSPRAGHTKLGSGDISGKGKSVPLNPANFANLAAPNGSASRPANILPTPPAFGHSLPVPPAFPTFDSQTKVTPTPSPLVSTFSTESKPLPQVSHVSSTQSSPQANVHVGLHPATPTGKPPALNPGNWSTQVTPGPTEDLLKRNSALTPTPSPLLPVHFQTNSTSKQDESDGTYPPRPYPSANFRPPVTPHMKPRAQLEPSEIGTDDEGDEAQNGRGSLSRNASWATTATAGAPSRQNSIFEPSGNPSVTAEPYYGQNLPNRPNVAAPEKEWAAESDDKVGPLNDQAKPPAKRVRWTPSVTGGQSSVASVSPPVSPRSEMTDLPNGSDIGRPGLPMIDKSKPATQPASQTPAKVSPTITPADTKPSAPPMDRPSAQPSAPPLQGWQAPFPNVNGVGQPPQPPTQVPGTQTRHRASASFSGVAPSLTPGAPPSVPPKPYPSPPPSIASSSAVNGGGRAPSPLQLQRASAFSPVAHSANGTPTSVSFRVPPPPPPSAAVRQLPTSLPFRLVAAAKKHSKFAASALEFDDLETARLELTRALAILNGEKTDV